MDSAKIIKPFQRVPRSALSTGVTRVGHVDSPKPIGDVRRKEFPTVKQEAGSNNIAIRVFVPSTRKEKGRDVADKFVGEKAFRYRIGKTMDFFSSVFGGGTQLIGIGDYAPREDNYHYEEPVGIIETSTDTPTWNTYDLVVRRWLKKAKHSLYGGQAAVTIQINGKYFFV